MKIPEKIFNWIHGEERETYSREYFPKLDPKNGHILCQVARSRERDVQEAIEIAKRTQNDWAEKPVVSRANIIRSATMMLQERMSDFAQIVSVETGKSVRDALGETNAAVEMGFFIAGEGRRYYGRTTTSATPNKNAMTVRQPLGVAGLIIAANTPIANVAWKVFPALLCGNTVILKPSEDTPISAFSFAKLLQEAGLPKGVFNVIQGYGEEAGATLVESNSVDVISFTGSCEVGSFIQKTAGARLAKVCLELGGKNPLIVCDDADLEQASHSAILSAYSNAGQRCASGSRIIVFESIYDNFRNMLLDKISALKIGCNDEDDFGPVINESQLLNMLRAVQEAGQRGAKILAGGKRLTGLQYEGGFFMAPTLVENASPIDPISTTELFGPIACLYKASNFEDALNLANDSPYGLTSAIHTKSMNRAMAFLSKIVSGVAVVNGPTYGSEPHMPFGGLKQSGNGLREAGTEALDVYSDWKTIYINFSPANI